MFHREGHTIILIFLFAVIGGILLLEYILDNNFIKITLQTISIVILLNNLGSKNMVKYF